MAYIPYEKMTVDWKDSTQNKNERLNVILPWVAMEFDVTQEDKKWIHEATSYLHTKPLNRNVQKFIEQIKDYPVSYLKPRKLGDFEGQPPQDNLDPSIDYSTPLSLLTTFVDHNQLLEVDINSKWMWDQEKILEKARIEGTNLYDPLSFVTYVICYRLDWESKRWVGQDQFGIFLENLLKKDESKFFRAIGWIAKQAWYITSEFCPAMNPALLHFPSAGRKMLANYIAEEQGHYKFMENVFKELDFDKDSFPIEAGSKWLMTSFRHAADMSPLAFTTMINIFEVGYSEEQEPTARLLSLSSRPRAARGFDLHHRINMEHRHCDFPIKLAKYLVPQSRSQILLTLGLFELTLTLFDWMEQRLMRDLGNNGTINIPINKMDNKLNNTSNMEVIF